MRHHNTLLPGRGGPAWWTRLSRFGSWRRRRHHRQRFHGRIPIAKVEPTDDGGDTWQEAEITYAGGENIWALWKFSWVPSGSGVFTLQVRATDTEGNVQTDQEDYDSDLDGFDGLDARTFEVS